MIISKIQKSYIHLFQINHLVIYSKFLPKNSTFLKTFHSEFEATDVCFSDQNSKPLEIEDRITLTLAIK